MNESISYGQRLSAIVVIFLLSLLSCNITLPSNQEEEAQDAADKSPIADTLGTVTVTNPCFLYTHNRDSIRLNLQINGHEVAGDLQFDNYQMDSSSGQVTGSFSADTLWLVYDFIAEGMHSNTEEVFLRQGKQLVRGVGERVETGDGLRYKNRNQISFRDGQVFHAIDCP